MCICIYTIYIYVYIYVYRQYIYIYTKYILHLSGWYIPFVGPCLDWPHYDHITDVIVSASHTAKVPNTVLVFPHGFDAPGSQPNGPMDVPQKIRVPNEIPQNKNDKGWESLIFSTFLEPSRTCNILVISCHQNYVVAMDNWNV